MLEFLIKPFINALLFLYEFIGEDFGLAIIIFTIALRLLTYPFTKQQVDSSKKMQDLTSSKKYKDMQRKYKNDKEKMAQEQMKLYQEMGINPFGSCLPSMIQMMIIIPVYFAVSRALVSTPLQLLQFQKDIYSSTFARLIPMNSQWLWIKDMGQPERLFLDFLPDVGIPVLTILVVITSFLQSKMLPTSSSPDDQGAQMAKSMTYTMPIMFALIAYSSPAGLALYFLISNLVGILQYILMGRVDWRNLLPSRKTT
ncbi:MAG: YidC/Oxa1 family membrane protein insertase [Anaerolineales bacterium]|jgi:YidC/Oxa1 family membrane protein insertase